MSSFKNKKKVININETEIYYILHLIVVSSFIRITSKIKHRYHLLIIIVYAIQGRRDT